MQPPTIARWLLNHFGCSPNNESIIGWPTAEPSKVENRVLTDYNFETVPENRKPL